MQHINLMLQNGQERRLTAQHLAMLLALALIVAAAYSTWMMRQGQEQQQRLAVAQANVTEWQQTLEAFRRVNPEIADNRGLLAEVETLQTERATRRALLGNLQRSVGLRNVSYYGFMETLARQRIDGVWLTEFGLDNRPGSSFLRVSLAGETEAAELLPRYLDRLRASRVGDQDLIDLTFNNMDLQRVPAEFGNGVPRYSFRLRTEALENPAEAQPAAPRGLPGLPKIPGLPGINLEDIPLDMLGNLP